MPQEFHGNVGSVQIWENEHIGSRAAGGGRQLDFRSRWIQGDICLKFAFDFDFKELFTCLSLGQGRCSSHAAGVRGAGASFGGMAEHGHQRFAP